jgi:hypothetical protein
VAGFLIDQFLAAHDFFGAESVIIASASSKTAIGLSHQLARRGTHDVIGLTAAANRAFVAGLGSYDRIVTYDELAELEVDGRAIFVDMAGAPEVRRAVHTRLGERLMYSSIVGNTHAAPLADETLPGPKPIVFGGPQEMERLGRELGPIELAKRIAQDWGELAVSVGKWLRVSESRGPIAVAETYRSLLANRARPEEGHVFTLT